MTLPTRAHFVQSKICARAVGSRCVFHSARALKIEWLCNCCNPLVISGQDGQRVWLSIFSQTKPVPYLEASVTASRLCCNQETRSPLFVRDCTFIESRTKSLRYELSKCLVLSYVREVNICACSRVGGWLLLCTEVVVHRSCCAPKYIIFFRQLNSTSRNT